MKYGGLYHRGVSTGLNVAEFEALQAYCDANGCSLRGAVRLGLHALVGDAIRPSVRSYSNLGLTPHTQEILDKRATGKTGPELAREYGVTPQQMSSFIQQALRKTNTEVPRLAIDYRHREVCRAVVSDPFCPMSEELRERLDTIARLGQQGAVASLGLSRQRIHQLIRHAYRLAGKTLGRSMEAA